MTTPQQDTWPYDKIFDQPREGLYMQQHITYQQTKSGGVEKIIVTRTFYGNDDYQDSTAVQRIGR